ncbi:hypothetical protein GSH19_04975 [Lactobacillus sp. S2-2]|uniref:helix-turn-helix domain-containing protein n=1 Tax=Lactobacillus sp. S2-2 TaxID=2692917 RepID=UPI001F1E9E89|nr:helix-turn-helix domain-containing protein [Lactobacillus sp. S2-2]MCF6515504.1 hypothetical protein [Lactobacillus sp. S2-2]
MYWVKLYQTYGLSGIKPMTNHIIYPGEFKQKVLHWMHTNHSSYPETALQFKISSPSVIFTWQRRLETKGLSGLYTTLGRPKMKNTNLNYKSDLNFDYYLIKYNYEVLKQSNLSWIDRLQRLFKQLTNYSKSFILKQLGISRSSYYYQKNKIDNFLTYCLILFLHQN